MNSTIRTIALMTCTVALTGCGSTFPLIFADKTSVGIDISGSEQGVDIALGFKTKSMSIIPVAVREKNKGIDGQKTTEIVPLQAKKGDQTDAYSTFGNFTVDTNAEGVPVSAKIGLGRFFATGMAADSIATKIGEALVIAAQKDLVKTAEKK